MHALAMVQWNKATCILLPLFDIFEAVGPLNQSLYPFEREIKFCASHI